MAINWTTYRSIPFLQTYAEAKRHHDNIVPIRGDENKTRPAARRDQKWFNIWEADGAVHVGYSSGKIVTFMPDGSIVVPARRSRSAATHERLSKMLGETFRTHQYDTWVDCVFFDNGKYRRGWLPLRNDADSIFLRHNNTDLIFVNYKLPVTHHVNKEKAKEALRPFVPFLSYMEGLAKLQERTTPQFERDTVAAVFGWRDGPAWSNHPAPNSPPNLRWAPDVEQVRADFFALAASDDVDDKMRAAITLVHNARWADTPRAAFMDQLMRGMPDAIFDKREHRDGKLVKDRYRRYLW